MGEMSAITYHGGRKKILWRIAMILTGIAVLIGVGFGIYKIVEVIRAHDEKVIYNDNSTDSKTAQEACDSIADEYNSNNQMYFSEAVQMFEDKKGDGDALWQMYFAVCYAKFVADEGPSLVAAPEILEGMDVSGLNKPARQYYFFSLANLYEDMGDSEKAEYYNAKGEELSDD